MNLSAQGTSVRLPLPVDGPAGALGFVTEGPTAAVLSGILLPSAGPLTAWAPVYSTLGADGVLTEDRTGGWVGPRPERWIKVVRAGFVVGGFRLLVRTGPPAVQTRQIQVFWKPWADGGARGKAVESRVYGAPAGAADQVKIVELTLPDGAVPTGLYGQTLGGAVVQVSLVVRQAPAPAAVAPVEDRPSAPAKGPTGPTAPTVGPVVFPSPF